MVIEVILTSVLDPAEIKCPETFMASLETRASVNVTCKLWLSNLC